MGSRFSNKWTAKENSQKTEALKTMFYGVGKAAFRCAADHLTGAVPLSRDLWIGKYAERVEPYMGERC